MSKVKGLVDYEDDEYNLKEYEKWSSLTRDSKRKILNQNEQDKGRGVRINEEDNDVYLNFSKNSEKCLSVSFKSLKTSGQDKKEIKDRHHHDTSHGKESGRSYKSSSRYEDDRRRSTYLRKGKRSPDRKRSRSRFLEDEYRSDYRIKSSKHYSDHHSSSSKYEHRCDDKSDQDHPQSKSKGSYFEKSEEKGDKVKTNKSDENNQNNLDKVKTSSFSTYFYSSPQPLINSVPKYYKPSSVNPVKFALQEEKKKLLWGDGSVNKSQSTSKSSKVWENLQFSGAQGQQMTEKFRKLMGIKSTNDNSNTNDESKANCEETTLKKQENLFRDLDKQYSMARMSTHTHRGIGLGFSSNSVVSKPGSSSA